MKAHPLTTVAAAHQCPYCNNRFQASYAFEPQQIECCGEVGHVTSVPGPFNPILLKKLHARLHATSASVSKIHGYDYGADENGQTFNWTTIFSTDTLLREDAVDDELQRTLAELASAVDCRPIQWKVTGGGWVFYMTSESVTKSSSERERFEQQVSFMKVNGNLESCKPLKTLVIRFTSDIG